MGNPRWTVRLHGHGGCAIFDHEGRVKRRYLTAAAVALDCCRQIQLDEGLTSYGIQIEEAPELHEAENKPTDLRVEPDRQESVEPT